MEDKKVINYNIPIQSQKDCDEHNAMCQDMFGANFTPILPTERHIDILLQQIQDDIQKVGDEGGWYLGDGVKVKVEIEYDPENK